MAILRRQNFLSQERVDVPAARSIESAVSNDFDTLIESVITGTSQGYFIRGFTIPMAGVIGGAASGLEVIVDPGAVLHISSSQSGTIYLVPTGTQPQRLNAATNTIVNGAFAPSSVNYVSLEYQRFADDTTSAQSYFFDPTSQTETVKNVPQAITLSYTLNISTSTPAANFLPIATVLTDSGNNVVSIEDNRNLLCRLGTGGVNPNPFHTYPWSEGRNENPSTSSSDSIDPFFGGDKAISNLKEWMDAVMSSFIEIKGTTYWYSAATAGSLTSLRQDLGNTIVTGKGSLAHGVSPVDKTTVTAPGQINWDQPINIKVIGSELTYSLAANPTSTDITLADDEAAYVTLVRDVIVAPNLIFTNGIAQVQSVGAVAWTSPLVAGDYIRVASGDYTNYLQILTVDSLTQVTLTANYTGASTGPAGVIAMYAFGSYSAVPVPSTNRDIFISTRETVPEGANVFWLFLRTDNGGSPTVYVRFLGAELDNGEDREVSGTTSAEVLKYMGSPSDSAFAPQYVVTLSPGAVPNITTITVGSGATVSPSQYFLIYSSADAREYVAWFKVNGVGSLPAVANTNASIEIDILSTDNANTVATKVALALNSTAKRDFKAVAGIGTVTVTNASAGACNPTVNGDVSAPFATVTNQAGTGIGNYVVQDGDNLTFAIKELDKAIGDIEAILDSPTYDEVVEIVASGATPPTSLNGPVSNGTLITLPNNSREGNIPQQYTVGAGTLTVFLNGHFVDVESGAYVEVGTTGLPSSQIQLISFPGGGLVVGDELELRIGAGGGGAGGGGVGPAGPPGPPGPPGANAAGGPVAISTKTSSYTVLLTDCFLRADATSGPVTFSLPPAATATGRIFYFKKVDSSANFMIISAFVAELIDGFSTASTNTQYQEFAMISNGTSWDIF